MYFNVRVDHENEVAFVKFEEDPPLDEIYIVGGGIEDYSVQDDTEKLAGALAELYDYEQDEYDEDEASILHPRVVEVQDNGWALVDTESYGEVWVSPKGRVTKLPGSPFLGMLSKAELLSYGLG